MVLSSHLHRLLAEAHLEERRREAAEHALAAELRRSADAHVDADATVVIRGARPEDLGALARLAQLDSAEIPRLPALLIEAHGEVRVAVSLSDGAVISDPFAYTGPLRDLLAVRAAQLGGGRRTRRRWLERLRGALRRSTRSRSPVG